MPPARGKGRVSRASNYSQAELVQLLNTIKELLPISPNGKWDEVALIHKGNYPESDGNAQNLHRKYTNLLYHGQIPTGNPNFPKEFDLEEGYSNSNSSSGEDDELVDISDDNNNIPPLCQPSPPTQPAQQAERNIPIAFPIKRSYARNRHMRTTITSTLVNIATLFANRLAANGRLHPLYATRDGVYGRDGFDFDGWTLTRIK
eukprot:jgi/Psemu1/11077/gm1.11077_g